MCISGGHTGFLPRPSSFSLSTPRRPISTLFPYTTLFRSPVPPAKSRHQSIVLPHPREMKVPPAVSRDEGRGTRDEERPRSEEHTSELQSHSDLVCRLLLEKKKERTTDKCQRRNLMGRSTR